VPEYRAIIAKAPTTKVPPGCADGVVERLRTFDTVVRANPDDPDSETIGKSDALKTEGRYTMLYPRAADWRAIARQLPKGPNRDAALMEEDAIADLLGDENWPRQSWPDSQPERRFAIRYFNKGLAVHPRDCLNNDGYCGPVRRVGDDFAPRSYVAASDADLVTRFERSASGDDARSF
jgi:hypothetical protein